MSTLAEWKRLPALLSEATAQITPQTLDENVPPEKYGMTRRLVVHHLAEATAVAGSIVIAALGNPGCTYDWSWMMPFGPWFGRLDYAHKPIGPAVQFFAALNAYVVAQVEPLADGLSREVLLKDAPDAPLRRLSVDDVLQQEIVHAHEHLDAFWPTR